MGIFKAVHTLICRHSEHIHTPHAHELVEELKGSPASTSPTALAESLLVTTIPMATAAMKCETALVTVPTAAGTCIATIATATHGDRSQENITRVSNGDSKTLNWEGDGCASNVVQSSLESDDSDIGSRVQTVVNSGATGALLQVWLRDPDSPPLRFTATVSDDVVGCARLRMSAIICRVMAPLEGHFPGTCEAASEMV